MFILVQLGSGGYPFLITNNGLVFYHPLLQTKVRVKNTALNQFLPNLTSLKFIVPLPNTNKRLKIFFL
jgi:hypothetical protein